MHKQNFDFETPRKSPILRMLHEYIEIAKTTRASIVDVISWLCIAACLITTLCYL